MNDITNKIDTAIKLKYFDYYPSEAARQLEQLPIEQIAEILLSKPIMETLHIYARLSPEIGAKLMLLFPESHICKVLESIDTNPGANLLRVLAPEKQEEILSSLKRNIAKELRLALSYPTESAGALMDVKITYLRSSMTVGEVLTLLRHRGKAAYRKLYTVDEEARLKGVIDIGELAISDHDCLLSEIEHDSPAVVDVMTTREEVVDLFEKYRLTDIPVVDIDHHLVGVVRHHVLINAALEENSADLQRMVGVSKDERALSPANFSMRKRLPWLQINLLTAFLAAAVVGLFENTIAQYTALAILLPVVAGQSGNTGAQALAVTMRGLALKEIYPRMWTRVVFKEFKVGLMNGLAVALTTGLGVYVWSQNVGLTIIIFMSMVLSMIIASVAGAIIPIMLTISGQDPATSSSIFLTTITDIAGFFSFLGIATIFIAML